jgi:hypothetical protein
MILCVVTPGILEAARNFGGNYRLHLRRAGQARNQKAANIYRSACRLLLLVYPSTLKIEAICSSETTDFQPGILCYSYLPSRNSHSLRNPNVPYSISESPPLNHIFSHTNRIIQFLLWRIDLLLSGQSVNSGRSYVTPATYTPNNRTTVLCNPFLSNYSVKTFPRNR